MKCRTGPAQLGAAAARIGAKFFCRRPHDFVCDLRVHSFAFTGLERFFDSAVFAGVKREDSGPAAGLEAERKVPQKLVQRAKLVIHCDSECLENTAYGIIVSSSAANNCGKF